MNLLFCTWFAVSPNHGGVERMVASLVSELCEQNGISCYSAYGNDIPSEFAKTEFSSSLHYRFGVEKPDRLNQFIREHEIDICLCFGDIRLMLNVINDCKGVKIVFRHTAHPGQESVIYDLKATTWLNHPLRSIKNLYQQWCYSEWLRKAYHDVYQRADCMIVMSPNHKDKFMRFGKINEDSKFRIIPNLLSYKTFFDMSDYGRKQKEVLIVGRLNEAEKHISVALRIWQSVEKINSLKEWHLTIVGSGPSENEYKEFVRKHNLKRVFFEGTQEPYTYYRRASIFMMTSKNESWGNVLTEAQMNGCVPLAFDSLVAISVIIKNEVNGVVIPKNNTRIYRKRLIQLMQDNRMRQVLAANAVESSHRFEQEKIGHQWYEMLQRPDKQA